MVWLKKCFNVRPENLICVVGINEMHRSRENIVKGYWSRFTRIPLKQFRKTSFKKVPTKKVYENFDEHYGTLSILVVKSTNLYYKINGLMEGLSLTAVHNIKAA